MVVAAGTGIGGALVVAGSLVAGRHGFAGSLGHLPAVLPRVPSPPSAPFQPAPSAPLPPTPSAPLPPARSALFPPAPFLRDRRCGCGALDHVEAYAAGPAIAADYAARAGLAVVPSLEEVVAAADGGDPHARAAIDLGAAVLGAGLAAAANLLDPDVVVIGGGVLSLGDRFLPGVDAALRAAALPGVDRVPLRPAALGNAAVLVGAALLAVV
ncbi:ROK family protein [Dactylosporangium sp. NPDC005572]|uniref:ROK family protein n=1 Tax=Dactylosporangium sp. NPDC005572 TaxID=3156889 RepID=UPI0033A311DC